MRRQRVLILVENLSVPMDRRVWQESRALVRAGYEVVVICPMGGAMDTEPEAVLEGVRILRYPLRAATGGPGGYVREYGLALWHTLRLALRVRREGPVDVVQACNPPDLLFLAALPLMAAGARFVFDHHDLVPELFRSRFGRGRALLGIAKLFERVTFALADGVISTNESYRQIALTRGRKAPGAVQVVRSAPDLSGFRPREPDPALRRGKRYLAAYLGVMGPQDGVDGALRALAHLRHDRGRDDLHTVLMGGGDDLDDLIALARDLGLSDCVEFTGDAAAYAPAGDERAFAALIDELLDDPDRRARMGAIGRARVADRLSWEVSERNLLDFYGRLLDRRRTRVTVR
jgi:glycosyltransferase involved in cell wall biosynthesis